MKKLFGRDKAKITRVTPASRDVHTDLGSGNSSEDLHSYSLPPPPPQSIQQPQHTPRPQPTPHTHTHTHHHHHHSSRDNPHSRAHSSDEEHWHVVAPDLTNPNLAPLEPVRPPVIPASRTPSLAPTPPGASPPVPSPLVPRSNSPLPPPSIRSSHTGNQKDKGERKPTAAVNILKALDPQFVKPNHDRVDESQHTHSEGSVRESREPREPREPRDDKKEKKGFWEWASSGVEREKEKREIREKEEESHQELMRMIGYLTATASEDWNVVLEVCDRASMSEANAKEAAKALRREFKYGDAPQQLSAARLWAIMLRNSNELFVHQCTSRKFLDILEDVLTSSRTSPVVRERLLDVLAAAAYASSSRTDGKEIRNDAFRGLWRKVKPPGKPDEGVPFDTDDAMFNPPEPRRSSVYGVPPGWVSVPAPSPAVTPQPQGLSPVIQTPTRPKNSSSRHRVIPPDEDFRRLLQECKFAHGNAQLLSEALTYARPEDLTEKEIIREFYEKCRASQELICAQVPWATAGADRSRQARDQKRARKRGPASEGHSPSETNAPTALTKSNTMKHHAASRKGGESPKKGDESPLELTQEEHLLAELLDANEALTGVLLMYDDIERIGIEREAEERSRKEVRMDRSKLVYDEREGYVHLEPPLNTVGSSSRTPSPSPSSSPSPIPISLMPAVHPSSTHPLPPIPYQHSNNPTTGSAGNFGAHVSQQSLPPPPPAPHGPRSPGYVPVRPRSRTPSPERHPTHLIADANVSQMELTAGRVDAVGNGLQRLKIKGGGVDSVVGKDSAEEEVVRTPVKPSLKALGKRKVIEAEEPDQPFNPDDMFYERTDRDVRQDDSPDSDDDEARRRPWAPVHYVYDAVAERTQQRLREGQLASLVNGVH